jgi:hypothetical protein
MYIGIVCGQPIDARRDIAWKTCTRIRWARLGSLIVIMNCCHSRSLRDHGCVVLSDCSLTNCKMVRIIATLSKMSDSCLLLSFRSNSTHFVNLYYEDDVDYFVVKECLI